MHFAVLCHDICGRVTQICRTGNACYQLTTRVGKTLLSLNLFHLQSSNFTCLVFWNLNGIVAVCTRHKTSNMLTLENLPLKISNADKKLMILEYAPYSLKEPLKHPLTQPLKHALKQSLNISRTAYNTQCR